MKAELPCTKQSNDEILEKSRFDFDNDEVRLDLDDLGGEIVLLDWGIGGYSGAGKENSCISVHKVMNGKVTAVIYKESKTTAHDPELFHRMVRLTQNHLIKPLPDYPKGADLIANDIRDIPRVCQAIQDEWKSNVAVKSLNRLTAYNLGRCLRKKMDSHIAGTVRSKSIDILFTGCEVSLWLSEQVSSDLKKSFPLLNIQALSANKLLGLYGQEIAVPSLGFGLDSKTMSLHDTIIIIVSHSGGTFSPLACSNLLQSASNNIFVVSSEWDTQIGRQLRAMDDDEENIYHSRIFSTDAGIRPAEPCSVTVAATHQLLTNMFEYICAVVLADSKYRRVTGCRITVQDLEILEKCNLENIEALEEIVGYDVYGRKLDRHTVVQELEAVGNHFAQHVLENARSYIMCFIYVFATVISGFPLFTVFRFARRLDVLDSDVGRSAVLLVAASQYFHHSIFSTAQHAPSHGWSNRFHCRHTVRGTMCRSVLK